MDETDDLKKKLPDAEPSVGAAGSKAPPRGTHSKDVSSGAEKLQKAEKKFMKTWQSWVVEKKITDVPLELNLEGNDLANAGLFKKKAPFAVVYLKGVKPEDQWEKFGDTEAPQNILNPKFVASFRMGCDTQEDRQQSLRIEFYNRAHKDKNDLGKQDFIGSATCKLEDILSAPGQVLSMELKHPTKTAFRGTCTLFIDTLLIRDPPFEITLKIRSSGPSTDKKKCYYVISRGLRKANWTPVYQSETYKGSGAPVFEPITLTQERLTAGADDRAFRIEIFSKSMMGKHESVGHFAAKYETLKGMNPGAKIPFNSTRDGHIANGVKLMESEITGSGAVFAFEVTE
ncbi:Copine-A [Porphyridium purpureum]|uniref:Copine-A n=1 Tax=Porphyridium purpureum TaxID=35688 RepID=A0A5J4Z1B1_PORPP|nr:Copine-A [Porphyridium purpureum]|eukprot:POR0316..scf208_2